MFGLMRIATHEADLADAQEVVRRAERERDNQSNRARVSGRIAAEKVAECDRLTTALLDIAAMETARCANIGKKMARRANKALAQVPEREGV